MQLVYDCLCTASDKLRLAVVHSGPGSCQRSTIISALLQKYVITHELCVRSFKPLRDIDRIFVALRSLLGRLAP